MVDVEPMVSSPTLDRRTGSKRTARPAFGGPCQTLHRVQPRRGHSIVPPQLYMSGRSPGIVAPGALNTCLLWAARPRGTCERCEEKQSNHSNRKSAPPLRGGGSLSLSILLYGSRRSGQRYTDNKVLDKARRHRAHASDAHSRLGGLNPRTLRHTVERRHWHYSARSALNSPAQTQAAAA